LASIPAGAFLGCCALKSIILPSSVKTLGVACFFDCIVLADSPLSIDSAVVRIGEEAFRHCRALTLLVLPASVEFVGHDAFENCVSLARLTFGSPSHLRELLDLPPALAGYVPIPDSVEVLSFCPEPTLRPQRTFTFGSGSRLRRFGATPVSRRVPSRSFVQSTSRSAKAFRMNLEFDETSREDSDSS
jgi:hypothetical protein